MATSADWQDYGKLCHYYREIELSSDLEKFILLSEKTMFCYVMMMKNVAYNVKTGQVKKKKSVNLLPLRGSIVPKSSHGSSWKSVPIQSL